ncbi:MAG: epoxyqueuosine reductase QueH [Eggerthellaceae bacterium]|nr:epoxyqueuosine reductase QueH [Eggerthellaceae bacterium]
MRGFEVLEGEYDPDAWDKTVAPIGEAALAENPFANWLSRNDAEDEQNAGNPEEGNAPSTHPQSVAELLDDERRKERCRACYRMRLEEAAHVAAEGGYEGLSTTLAVSPYQFTDVIREELERAASQCGVQPVFQDFRPYYDEATRISRELGMYRQNYCGCRFSVAEGQATREFIKQLRARDKARKARERIALEEEIAKQREEKRAYADKQARKRAVLKQLREMRS